MKNVQAKAIQIGGYMRIIAVAIAIAATLIFGSKAFAIAPHMPDMALQAEIDMHRESVEKAKDRKAYDKVEKHKEHKKHSKIKEKGSRDKIKEKATGKKKDKTKKEKTKKPPKPPKPPKPSRADKKRAARERARNIH
jgi:outer membrane biosynthesis protein TonB